MVSLHTDEDQAVWVFYRKALQPQRVHQRKDRCVRADTERQRQHRDEYEAGRPAELAQGISCILAQVFEPGPRPFFGDLVAKHGRISKEPHGRVLGLLGVHA